MARPAAIALSLLLLLVPFAVQPASSYYYECAGDEIVCGTVATAQYAAQQCLSTGGTCKETIQTARDCAAFEPGTACALVQDAVDDVVDEVEACIDREYGHICQQVYAAVEECRTRSDGSACDRVLTEVEDALVFAEACAKGVLNPPSGNLCDQVGVLVWGVVGTVVACGQLQPDTVCYQVVEAVLDEVERVRKLVEACLAGDPASPCSTVSTLVDKKIGHLGSVLETCIPPPPAWTPACQNNLQQFLSDW